MRILDFFLSGFLFCSLLSAQLSAQTLHVFLVANTNDAETGKGHAKNLERMQSEVSAISRSTQMTLDTTIITGNLLSATYVRSQLENFECQAEDIVIFYFSGREYLPTRYRGGSKDAFLDLKNGFMSPSAVNELIEIQKPKLTIVITDLCNQADETKHLNPQTDKIAQANYDKLFRKSSGKLFFNNHIAREQSDLALSSEGGIFTGSVIQAIRESEDWDNVINRSQALTIGYSQGTQNPQATAQISTSTSTSVNEDVADSNNNELPEQEEIVAEKRPKNQINLRQEISTAKINTQPVTNTKTQQTLHQQSTQAVQDFQQNLSRLAEIGMNGNHAEGTHLTEKTLALFMTKKQVIETSGLSQRISKKIIEPYLRAFYQSNSPQKIAISWYQAPKIGEIRQTDGKYFTDITVYQEYVKKDSNGNIIYGDRVPKRIEVVFIPDASEPTGYRIQFGNIRVVGKTMPVLKK